MADIVTTETYEIYQLATKATDTTTPDTEAQPVLINTIDIKSFPPQQPIGAYLDVLSKDGNTYTAVLVNTQHK